MIERYAKGLTGKGWGITSRADLVFQLVAVGHALSKWLDTVPPWDGIEDEPYEES